MNSRVRVYITDDTLDYQNMLVRLGCNGVPESARLIYDGRNRIYEWEGLSIKEFKRPGLISAYLYRRLRDSKALRSFNNAKDLASLGIGTPEPIGAVEFFDGWGRLLRSFYVCRHVEAEGDMRLWLENPAAMERVPKVAALLAKMHYEEIRHRDFSPGNILFSGDDIYLIDLNRIDWGVSDRSKLMKNLGVIYIESEAETERFARLYAEAAGMDAETAVRAALEAREAYLVKKGRLYKLKTILLGLVGRKPKRPPHPLWKI